MHQYHTHIEQFLEGALKHTMDALKTRLVLVLENMLSKLKRYDENSLLKSLLSLTVSIGVMQPMPNIMPSKANIESCLP